MPSTESTKEKIIKKVAQNTYLSNDVVRDVINEYLKVLRKEIVETGRITIQGIMSIKTGKKKSHTRIHPGSKKEKVFPESDYLRVSLSKPLRDEFQKIRRSDSSGSREDFPKQAPKNNSRNLPPVPEADDFDAELNAMFDDDEEI